MLSGKRCLITGASRGIGEAIALLYSKEGASLFLTARNEEKLTQVVTKCKENGAKEVEYICLDLSGVDAAQTLAKAALDKFSTIDVLVNNAGVISPGGVTCLGGDPKEWNQMMELNVLAPMTLMHLIAPGMIKQEDGVVINIGSVAGVEPMQWAAAYAASKWALRGWSLSCYNELRNYNVKVCLISPGMVRTDFIPARANAIPERMIEPEDIAEAAMLPFKLSSKCVPSELTLRLTKYGMK
eukprot:g8787.t1